MSLQVWLPLNGDLHNQGLNGLTATNNGATIDNNGKIGKCYSFNGNNYITLPTSLLTNFTNEISVCTWVNITAWNSSYDSIIKMYAGNNAWNNSIFAMGRNNTASRLYFSIANGLSSTQSSCTLTTDQITNTWYHIACVYNYTDKNMKIYLNGELKTTYATTIVPNFSSVTSIGIGGSPLASYGLKGKLNDVRIYNHALSPKEVEEVAKGLVLYYKLDNNGMGGDNLAANTSIMKTLTTFEAVTYCSPINFYTQTMDGLAILHNATTSDIFTVSFDYVVTGADTSFDIAPSLKCTSYSFNRPTWISKQNATIPVGGSSGHFIGIMHPNAEQITYGEGWLISVGTNNRNISILISNFKFEQGSTATTWSPAPSDTEYPASYKTTVYDSSGYSHNGTIVGSLTAAAGSPRYEIATQFPGNAYSKCTSPSTECQTISVWAKWNSIPSGQSIIYIDYKSKTGLGLMSTGILCSSCGLMSSSFSKATIVANTWYHFVVVCPNGSANAIRQLYINGVEQTAISSTSNNWSYTIDELQVGKRSTTSDGFDGWLSDFRIYATALTATQIKELYETSMLIDTSGNIMPRELVS